MGKDDDLYAEVNRVNKLEKCCEKIEKLVKARLDETIGRFDWSKSVDGKLILEIRKALRDRL